ncbi:MAG: response regulator transcription factor [Planctomycetes bacterium]|nr:response regulator transcription factor [Planctomycetota bacterium]
MIMTIRVIVAEDHAIVREGLCALIEREPDLEVVYEAQNGQQAVEQARQLKPDVVVMDVSMPDINGIEATRKIKIAMTDVQVLALSVHDKPEYVMDMIKMGASGYLLKDCVSSELVHAIRRVAANESYLSPKIASIVINEHLGKQQSSSDRRANVVLKDDELDILKRLVEGETAGQIADHYKVTVKAIEARRRRILSKLNIDNFADLVKYAIREGLTSC